MIANGGLHQAVMLNEAIHGLAIKPEGIYIDATYGRGGHSQAMMSQLNAQGQLIAIDQDLTAVEHAHTLFSTRSNVHLFHGSFAELGNFAQMAQVNGCVNGILFDLGVSSPHLDDASRGFSFMREGPLDMRMDRSSGWTAAEWLATVSEKELAKVLYEYGEERYGRRIAAAIVAERERMPLHTTTQLAAVIAAASPSHDRHKHPATRSFQAIRIFINQELEALETALEQALDVLAVGGRLVVISFHSLEDRMVKQFMHKHSKEDSLPRKLPIMAEKMTKKRLIKIGSAIHPSDNEINENPRARSAILRIAEKIS